MEKEKLVFFLDYANINRAASGKRYHIDYRDLLHYVGDGRFLIDAYCYVPINPRNEHRMDRDIEEFWHSGYIVHTKSGSSVDGMYWGKCAVEITMDIFKAMYQMKPDIIVLATGDTDFLSLIQEVRKSGVRIEVAAFEETVDPEIILKCSGFINLTEYYKGYLAAQNSEQREESREEAYKDLIQSQEGDLREVLEEEAKLIVDLMDKETRIPQPEGSDSSEIIENIDELNM
jgi:uncharacterized LabA/DUF88 family protein